MAIMSKIQKNEDRWRFIPSFQLFGVNELKIIKNDIIAGIEYNIGN